MIRFILSIIRLPLELIYWFVDLLRVSRFVFSANEKVTRRCPFGCYDTDSIVKDGIRKCKSANRYYNFWLFRTLCRCAQRPPKPIPGITAFCRERGSFEITFARWCIIVCVAASVVLGIIGFITFGVAGKIYNTVTKDVNRTTLRTVSQITKPKPIRKRPKALAPRVTPARLVVLDGAPIATSDNQLLTATTHAFIDAESPMATLRIARGYVAIGLRPQGRKALEQCRQANPTFAPAALTAVLYACQESKPESAKAYIAPFLKEEALPVEITIAAAIIALTEGKPQDAGKYLASLDKNAANSPAARLAASLVKPSQVSVQQLQILAAEFPDLPVYLTQLLHAGNPEDVLAKAISIAGQPQIPAHLPGKAARYLWKNGRRNQAASAAAAIVQITPADLDAQWVNASVYFHGGAADKAASIAAAAIRLAPSPLHAADLMRIRAQALQQAKRFPEAIVAWESLLQLGPDEAATNAIREMKK